MAKEPDTTDKVTTDEKPTTETSGNPVPAIVEQQPDQDMISLIATGSFHEHGNFQGKLLQAGDTFTAERARAVELRANGLVRYADAEAEKAAAVDDVPPSEDNGAPVITSRSIRRAKT